MRAGCRLLPIVVLALAGCRNVQHINQELLESELRTREIQYRDLLDDFKRTEHHNHALQHELDAVRHGSKITPETAAQTFGLKRITLGRGTGGYDNDKMPGDEGIYVNIEPRDSDEHVIKSPGTLYIAALEITPQGTKVPLSEWDIDQDRLRQAWKPGLLSSGYSLQLPWKSWPTSEQLRIVVKLVTSDGRTYEADRDIKVRIAPDVNGKPVPPRIDEGPRPPRIEEGPRLPPKVREGPLLPPKIEEGPLPAPLFPSLDPMTPGVQKAFAWQPANLANVVQLGRPVPLGAGTPLTPSVSLLGITGGGPPDFRSLSIEPPTPPERKQGGFKLSNR